MAHTDEGSPKASPPQHVIDISFCDSSTAQKTYDATTFGGLTAREDYRELCDKGNENDSIWGEYPHIVLVRLSIDEGSSSFESFSCGCKAKVASSA